jgi:hypothetical protein
VAGLTNPLYERREGGRSSHHRVSSELTGVSSKLAGVSSELAGVSSKLN